MLLAEGHSDARCYPIAVVWSEARIVRQRLVDRRRNYALDMQTVIASVLSKEGGKRLSKHLKEMDDGY
jgi:hypothetical protein